MELNTYKELSTELKSLADSNKNMFESIFQAVQNLQTVNVRMESRIADLETQIAQLSVQNQSAEESATTGTAMGASQDQPASSRKELSVTRLTTIAPDIWHYDGVLIDEVNLCVDDPVSVSGFLLYGSHSGTAAHRVAMQISHPATGRVLANHQAILKSDGSQSLFPVRFASPVDLEPEVTYTASVTVSKGLTSWRGKGGLRKVTGDCGTEFTFSDADNYYTRNGSDETQGQIPGILYMV